LPEGAQLTGDKAYNDYEVETTFAALGDLLDVILSKNG
jgi:hypothetical protein